MPYSSTSELPAQVKSAYSERGQRAFVSAFNDCAADSDDEERCFRIAHAAAKRASDREESGMFASAEELARQAAERVAARDVPSDERKRLAKEGKAMSDGSFPIANESDLRNAIKAYGRAANKEAAKRHIIKRAKALGKTDLLPDDWQDGGKESSASLSTGVQSVRERSRESSTPVQSDVTRAFVTESEGKLILTAPGRPETEVADYDSENPNFVYLRGAYVGGEVPNKNGALWQTADLEMGEPTIRHGPLNWLHEERKVIGAITEASLVKPSAKLAAAAADAHPYIAATSVMWRFLWPDEAKVIEHAGEQGRLWYSMECISRAVECVDHGCGEFGYMEVARKSATVCEHIRERSGTRRFVDPIFLGGAVIVPPARPGWDGASTGLMQRASDQAEAAYEQAGRPDIPASDWEALMARVLEFAESSA